MRLLCRYCKGIMRLLWGYYEVTTPLLLGYLSLLDYSEVVVLHRVFVGI